MSIPAFSGPTQSTYESKNLHIRFKLNGSVAKREFFNFLVTRIDKDFPFGPKEMRWPNAGSPALCSVCKGFDWRNPGPKQPQIQALARQINRMKELPGHLKLRVQHWRSETHCLRQRRVIVAPGSGVNVLPDGRPPTSVPPPGDLVRLG